jgi:predicted DNA-binding WGR domain protein
MVLAHLHRINVRSNMARFYHVDVALTLFGEVSVLRTWGRIGTRGRTAIETCATMDEVDLRAMKTIKAKLRRGYHSV